MVHHEAITVHDPSGRSLLRAPALAICIAGVVVCLAVPVRAQYPRTLTADAQMKTETTTITSKVTIRVLRLMEENRRTRVTDALRFSGYANFLNALRTLPPIGSIEVEKRMVELRYAHEEMNEKGLRLLLIADRPLFFLGDPAKSRTGYELTIVELYLDGQGGATGTMTGAARVKPTAEGGVVLDTYSEAPVQLTARESRP